MEKTTNIAARVRQRLGSLKGKLFSSAHHSVVRDFSEYLQGPAKGTALLSYRTLPVEDLLAGKKAQQFSNDGAIQAIVQVLNELGYVVDVIDWDDGRPELHRQYDVLILHGGINYEYVKSFRKPHGSLIYYSSGSYWKYHNEQEAARFRAFEKRHGIKLAHDRHIGASEEPVNQAADLIISLGNTQTASTYSAFKQVAHLQAASIPETRDIPIRGKDYATTRKHFLFMAGPGNIHKGLDRALDYFRLHSEYHLHIMTKFDDQFEDYYHAALHDLPNIHSYGYVPFRSAAFYEIIDRCAYSLLFSCSEGSPGSVIESMEQGLIPIITKSSHLDIGDAGYVIDDVEDATISGVLEKAADLSPQKVHKLACASRDLIAKKYRPEHFRRELRGILSGVLQESTDS